MRAESIWRRQGYTLAPWSAEARDALLALSEGGECVGNLWVPRNRAHNAKYWKLCTMAGEMTGKPREGISDSLLVSMGLYDRYVDSMGRLQIVPRSPNFQTMDEVDFKSFTDHAIPALAELIGADPEAMQREFLEACRRAT